MHMFPLSRERQKLFDDLDEELRGEVIVDNLGKKFNLLSVYKRMFTINVSGNKGCHYGANNVFLAIIKFLEENGIPVGEERVEVNPDTSYIIESTSGNAGAACAITAKRLKYKKCILVIPNGLPEARYRALEELGAEVVRTERKQYVAGMPPKLLEFIKQNKERHKKGKKIFVSPNHSVGKSSNITVQRMGYIVEQFLEQYYEKYDTGPIDKLFVTFGNGTSLYSFGKGLKNEFPDLQVIGTADFAYGGGYDQFAERKGLSSYEKLYGIKPGTLRSHFKLLGANARIGVKLPLQERAFDEGIIDDYILCTHHDLLNAYKKLSPSSEQLQNALKLPHWDHAPTVLWQRFGNTSLANTMTAAQNLGEGEIGAVVIYDPRHLYFD